MCGAASKMPRVAKGVTHRKSISLDTKLKILERIDENIGASAVGREFRMAESTVRTIVKNKDKILRSCQSATPLLKVSRSRGAIFEKMENRLSTWIEEMNQRDVPVTQAMIMVEAKRIFDDLKEADGLSGAEFKASRGWFDRFKRRANLRLVRLRSECNLETGEQPRTFRSMTEDNSSTFLETRKGHNVLYRRKHLLRGSGLRKANNEILLRRKILGRKKSTREKTSSPRVTLRLHQIKERKEKAKSSAAVDKTGHHDYNNGGNMESNKGSEDAATNKEPGTGNEEIEAGGEQGAKDSSISSPKEMNEPDVAPVKRSHSTEDEGIPEESRKKRRKEGGKSGSNSGGSPKSVVESEGEDAKSVGSPGPKVPPLKIVIAGASLEEPGSGRPGKNGGSRHHLPYVVSTSSGGEGEATSPPSDDHEEHGKRILRSHRSGGGSGNSSPAAAAGETPPRCGITSPPPQQPEPEEKPAEEPPPVELHPRKRKLRPKESATSNAAQTNTNQSQSTTEQPEPQHFSDLAVSNSYQLFLNIRKQIERKRKGLFPVQPKPPQGFKDYLMNRCTYVLAGNAANRVPPPSTNPPASVSAQLKDLYISQEKERHRLLMQHVIEKEKLVLSVEQEILRVHGRAARALANQALPFSACTILRDEEVYSAITPEQEEKDRNARSRYNGRLFLSWLQDVDDKWEKIKEAMLLRHHNEAESLHAVQKMDWEWKLKEVGLCDFKVKPVIDDNHVPMVHVSDDFDLLPA